MQQSAERPSKNSAWLPCFKSMNQQPWLQPWFLCTFIDKVSVSNLTRTDTQPCDPIKYLYIISVYVTLDVSYSPRINIAPATSGSPYQQRPSIWAEDPTKSFSNSSTVAIDLMTRVTVTSIPAKRVVKTSRKGGSRGSQATWSTNVKQLAARIAVELCSSYAMRLFRGSLGKETHRGIRSLVRGFMIWLPVRISAWRGSSVV